MNIKISKENLLTGLTKVGKAVTGKSTNPILQGVYMECSGNSLIFRGTDNDISVETKVEAEVLASDSMVVDYKIFIEVVRKLPNSMINLEKEGQEVNISCEKSNITILTLDENNYPNFPKIDEKSVYIKIPQTILKELILGVSFAAAQDETRPILQGILFEHREATFPHPLRWNFRLLFSVI